jgi:phosphate transport system substrate-binding protein
MKKFFKIITPAVIIGWSLIGYALAGDSVTINGSTTVLPIAQKAAEEYMKKNPGINISVRGTGSGDGIKALIDKSTDIATSSRVIKKEEIESAAKKGVTPIEHQVSLDAIAIVVNPANPVNNITKDQIKAIYVGDITNWKELGGENKEIVAISRDSSSGTYEFFVEHVLKKEKPMPECLLQASSGAVAQTVAKNKYAIGYIGLGYINNDLKALSVNDVRPSVETVHNNTYPIWRPLYMYTDGEPKGEVKKFIDFAKGPDGQKIVEEEGFVPLKK